MVLDAANIELHGTVSDIQVIGYRMTGFRMTGYRAETCMFIVGCIDQLELQCVQRLASWVCWPLC